MKLLNPIPNSKLKKYPLGDTRQYFGVNGIYYGRLGILGHNGIDIATKYGDMVVAAHSGKVAGIYYNQTLGGQVISITGDERFMFEGEECVIHTVYGHLIKDSQQVKIDDIVKVGQFIGLEGNTGFIISGGVPYWGDAPNQIGTHLHFGCYIVKTSDWKYKNPENGFKGAYDPMIFLEVEDKEKINTMMEILENAKWLLKQMLNKLKSI